MFKLCVYESREKKFINLNNLIMEIRQVKRIEKEMALTNSMTTIAFTKKWLITVFHNVGYWVVVVFLLVFLFVVAVVCLFFLVDISF